jgi:hypothetical protein
MNGPTLKVLAGVALIMVIVASGVVILRTLSADPPAPARGTDPPEPGGGPTDGGGARAVSSGPPPPTIKGPVSIAPDNPLQPAYKPVNRPAYLQFLRQQGKTYSSQVVGKVSGRASKKDWGLRGVAYFEYLYAVESKGKILKNDGVKVVEERHFGKVNENLLVSSYEVVVELPDELDKVFSALAWFGPQAAAVAAAGRTAKNIVNNVRLPVSKEWVDLAREKGLFSKFPDLDPRKMESELRMFTQGSDNRLLEGKTVRIVFIDGKGVESVEGVGCELTPRERDLVVRTNFVMDHYLFPDRKVEPGHDWTVNGDVFSGFLDPRLHGRVGGEVTVLRAPDFVDHKDEVSKRVKIVKGTLVLRDEAGGREITGQITNLRGACAIPDRFGVVTSGTLQGYADYKAVTKDHLLFAAETTFTPRLEVSYACTVE